MFGQVLVIIFHWHSAVKRSRRYSDIRIVPGRRYTVCKASDDKAMIHMRPSPNEGRFANYWLRESAQTAKNKLYNMFLGSAKNAECGSASHRE